MAALVDLSAADAPQHLLHACKISGFAVLTGHGVPAVVVDNMREAQRQFFKVRSQRLCARCHGLGGRWHIAQPKHSLHLPRPSRSCLWRRR